METIVKIIIAIIVLLMAYSVWDLANPKDYEYHLEITTTNGETFQKTFYYSGSRTAKLIQDGGSIMVRTISHNEYKSHNYEVQISDLHNIYYNIWKIVIQGDYYKMDIDKINYS